MPDFENIDKYEVTRPDGTTRLPPIAPHSLQAGDYSPGNVPRRRRPQRVRREFPEVTIEPVDVRQMERAFRQAMRREHGFLPLQPLRAFWRGLTGRWRAWRARRAAAKRARAERRKAARKRAPDAPAAATGGEAPRRQHDDRGHPNRQKRHWQQHPKNRPSGQPRPPQPGGGQRGPRPEHGQPTRQQRPAEAQQGQPQRHNPPPAQGPRTGPPAGAQHPPGEGQGQGGQPSKRRRRRNRGGQQRPPNAPGGAS
jgi:hypothetical protein